MTRTDFDDQVADALDAAPRDSKKLMQVAQQLIAALEPLENDETRLRVVRAAAVLLGIEPWKREHGE